MKNQQSVFQHLFVPEQPLARLQIHQFDPIGTALTSTLAIYLSHSVCNVISTSVSAWRIVTARPSG
jgi:hypothetical protein